MAQSNSQSKLSKKARKKGVELHRQQLIRSLKEWIASQPDKKVLRDDFFKKVNSISDYDAILARNVFIRVEDWMVSADDIPESIKEKIKLAGLEREKREQERQKKLAIEREKREKEEKEGLEAKWEAILPLAGTTLRPGATKAKSNRLMVVARTYTEESAAKRLSLSVILIREAVKSGFLPSFVDPENRRRLPAESVEAAASNAEILDALIGLTPLKIRDMAIVTGVSYSAIRGRLQRAGFSTTEPHWGEVKGKWGLPESLEDYKKILAERYPVWLKAVLEEKYGEERPRAKTARELRRENEVILEKLYEIFPSWENRDRVEQKITLHLGPTNSGKTHHGLQQLAASGSGWYLAPLRLLAHEVFDTLNRNGTPCNLLTGEEVINVDGATITSATIEMFSPQHSGECVVIDEAHMLADAQRGWAWTRAIMENKATEVHIIGSPIVEPLIKKMTSELGVDITVETYKRLTPLEVSHAPWALSSLPPKTILVAFSRQTVLALKTKLEKEYHRSVSVVYGNLPPEVRLKQAERFVNGETEICVATDAIGMGLNLPADNVCFFEVEKFDGVNVRELNVNEIRQIGGRAGRFGLSDKGLIGALSKQDLSFIREAVNSPYEEIETAYINPTPESIALFSGALYEKLNQWFLLEGIPPKWKLLLKPVDLSNQIELARQLKPSDVETLGEDVALLLINAPCTNDSEDYWKRCATAIIKRKEMPVPTLEGRDAIHSAKTLGLYEQAIRCADIYLWLSQREPFMAFAPFYNDVRQKRNQWIERVDMALQKKIDTARRCDSCGRPLALDYRFKICQTCYQESRFRDKY
jgi:hypothetical protein